MAHRLLHFAVALSIAIAALLAFGAWRLAQGPVESQWLVDRVTKAALEDMAPLKVSFGSVQLMWDGFNRGVHFPLDLHVSGLVVDGGGGIRLLTADVARVRFSVTDLILGRTIPRAIEVDRARISLTRGLTGRLRTGGTADDDVTDLRQLFPSGSAGGSIIPPRLQQLHFNDLEIGFQDAASGLTLGTPGMAVDIVRQANGHYTGGVQGPVTIGGQRTSATVLADFASGGGTIAVDLGSLRPDALAVLPGLAFLGRIAVPVSIVASLDLGTGLDLRHFHISALAGGGTVRVGNGTVPLVVAEAMVDGTTDHANIAKIHAVLAQAADGLPETADLSGSVTRAADRLSASLNLSVDHIDAADLPKLWPDGIGGNVRPWLVEHILGGIATHGSVGLTAESGADLQDITVTRATGDMAVSNASFTWLDGMPPVVQAEAHLHLVDPDTLDLTATTARQVVGPKFADLIVSDASMRILGLSLKDQIAHIHARIDGPVISSLALMSEPRLELLSAHPLGLKPVAGQGTTTLDLDFPLENKLQFDDIGIHALTRATKLRVLDAAAGRALDDATADLNIGRDGLSMTGSGTIAGIPLALTGTMDFRDGAPDQVVRKIAASGLADGTQLDAAGLHTADTVTGPVGLNIALTDRRNGESSVVAAADLSGAALHFAPLAWTKLAGTNASARAVLQMSHGRLTKIDRIAVTGDRISLNGTADFKNGQIRSLSLDDFALGRTQGRGIIHFTPDGSLGIVLQGNRIDLEPKLTEPLADKPNPVSAPPWDLEAHFERALLAHGETASDLLMRASGDGENLKTIDMVGSNEGSAAFSVKIAPGGGKRTLMVRAANAGRFLRGMDIVRTMSSGQLTVDGTLESAAGFSPLAAKASMTDVVVRNSPILGKLLQAITLYGLVDALSGPGMLFPSIAVPFHYDGKNLDIEDALATNPSLGLTASGRIGLVAANTALNGTIVPAYFFNSIPGQLPFIGKLFSPEKGGGLFAARFSVQGSIADPNIMVNPISALTPGFLREIFGIFDNKETTP